MTYHGYINDKVLIREDLIPVSLAHMYLSFIVLAVVVATCFALDRFINRR